MLAWARMKFEVSFVRPVWSLQVDAPTPHPTATTPFPAPGDPFVALYGSGYTDALPQPREGTAKVMGDVI